MRDQHAQDGQAFHGACKNLFPCGLGAIVGHAAIDCGPAMANAACGLFGIFEQPQVDVVERKRQLHPNPQNAWRHSQGLAQCGQRVTQWKTQRLLTRIEPCWGR